MDDSARDDRAPANQIDAESMVDAMAPLLGFDLTPESRAEAASQLAIAANRAALVLALEFDDEDEPAPVFRA